MAYGLLAFMIFGPSYRQIVGSKNRIFRNWVMFKGIGVGMIDPDYFVLEPDGKRKPIDRFAVLGFSSRWEAPKLLRRIRGRYNLDQVNRQLCAKLGPGVDLRAITRRSTRLGWQVLEQGERNLCGRKGRRR